MASFSKMEIAKVLSNDSHISVKKGFLGLSTKVLYAPTGEPMTLVVNEYDVNGAATIETILKADDNKLQSEIKRLGKPQPAPIGGLRLEAAVSADRQWAAVQAFRYVDLRYKPVCDFRILEGAAAEAISSLF